MTRFIGSAKKLVSLDKSVKKSSYNIKKQEGNCKKERAVDIQETMSLLYKSLAETQRRKKIIYNLIQNLLATLRLREMSIIVEGSQTSHMPVRRDFHDTDESAPFTVLIVMFFNDAVILHGTVLAVKLGEAGADP